MTIKATSDAEVRTLIDALGGAPDRREAAIARLIIIGARAVGRLVDAYGATPDRDRQVAILRVLEVSGDRRAVEVARRATATGGDVAVGGVAVLRELLARDDGALQAQALDTLLAVARDPAADRRVRAAAAQALDTAPEDVRQALKDTVSSALPPDEALWADAADGRLPDDPSRLREAIASRAAAAPLPVLRRLIESIRDREQQSPRPSAQDDWRGARGAVHQALALRGSRVGLYDLRETLERTTVALPASFLAAVQTVGDESCLEPLAAAFSHAAPDDERWRHQLAQTFRAVVKRERLTRKHSALGRALSRAPALGGTPPQ